MVNSKNCMKINYSVLMALGIGILAIKLIYLWYHKPAKTVGETINCSIKKAVSTIDKAIEILQNSTDKDLVKKIGNGIDETLGEAKKALDTAASVIEGAVKGSKL